LNKREWLKFIPKCKEAHHIREIYNGTYLLIGEPAVQKQFFDKIDSLLGSMISEHTRRYLGELREDIEDEIETCKKRNSTGTLVERKKMPDRPSLDPMAKHKTVLRIIESLKEEIQRIEKLMKDIIEESKDVEA
jgi:hypothetical protein